jgi:hypothetical protein
MVSWEYIRKRRRWTAELILASLPDQNWESFQAFFSERGIECPDKGEYNSALSALKPEPIPKAPEKQTPAKKQPSRAKKKKPAAG